MIGQLMALAQWHQTSGRALEAESLYRRALDIDPRQAAIHRGLGMALLTLTHIFLEQLTSSYSS